jgi:hypothetical protein
MALSADGNVGIGTTAPTAKLDISAAAHGGLSLNVSGTAKMTGFQMPTGATNGYVLTANAGGFGSWLPAPSSTGPWSTNGTSVYYNDGNVGIGTSAPSYKLSVAGDVYSSGDIYGRGSFNAINSAGAARVTISGADVSGSVVTMGPNNAPTNVLTWVSGYPYNGYVGVHRASALPLAGAFVNSAGQGIVFGDVKNFREPSRKDETKDIWYACVEGPEAAAYIRGTAALAGGSATVELPDHFQEVATLEGMTVQVTPHSADSKGLAVVTRALDRFTVRELFAGTGTYEFDWEVKVVRRAHQDYEVMRPWDEALPGGTDKADAWQARLTGIQERDRRIETFETQRKGR